MSCFLGFDIWEVQDSSDPVLTSNILYSGCLKWSGQKERSPTEEWKVYRIKYIHTYFVSNPFKFLIFKILMTKNIIDKLKKNTYIGDESSTLCSDKIHCQNLCKLLPNIA